VTGRKNSARADFSFWRAALLATQMRSAHGICEETERIGFVLTNRIARVFAAPNALLCLRMQERS
jgi:hypothetical protein